MAPVLDGTFVILLRILDAKVSVSFSGSTFGVLVIGIDEKSTMKFGALSGYFCN